MDPIGPDAIRDDLESVLRNQVWVRVPPDPLDQKGSPMMGEPWLVLV